MSNNAFPFGAVNVTAAALALCCTLTPAARADDFNLIDQKFQAGLGVFLNGSELDIQANGQTVDEGTRVDWGKTFGDEDVNRFRLDAVWRINKRHHLRLMYTDYTRSSTRNIGTEIEWQDEVFPVGASVKGSLGFEIIEAAYEYAFLRSGNYEVAGSIGLHYTSFEAKLSATVTAPQGGGTRSIDSPASMDAPLPVLGLHGMWRLGSNFYLDGHAQAFALTVDEFDGSIVNYRAALLWQPKRAFGIGLGYDYFQVDIDVDRARLTGSMDWTYSGPQAFLNFSF